MRIEYNLAHSRGFRDLKIINEGVKELNAGMFKHFSEIRTLSLSLPLTNISENAFVGSLQNLETLRIAYAPNLTTLPIGAFEGLDNVYSFELESTGVTYIKFTQFQGMPKLKHISLSNNNDLTSISSQPFQVRLVVNRGIRSRSLTIRNSPKLRTMTAPELLDVVVLRMNNAPLIPIVPQAFAGMRQLRELQISGTSVRSIQNGTFDGLPNLYELRISSNDNLSTIDAHTFDHLPELTLLYMGYNAKLHSLPNDLFTRLPKLYRFVTNHSPLRCHPRFCPECAFDSKVAYNFCNETLYQASS